MKYGDDHESISDILKCWYKEIGGDYFTHVNGNKEKNQSSTLPRSKEESKRGDEGDIGGWDEGSFGSISEDSVKVDKMNKTHAKLNVVVHPEFIYNAPQLDKNKIQKMNTLRIKKIQHLMSDKADCKGIKIFDLHLLNMKKYVWFVWKYSSKSKYLQAKDIIEVALIFCLFDG